MGELVSNSYKHIAICPSAGIGHLQPFLRLASMLSSTTTTTTRHVTIVIIRPTLSTAETTLINNFLSAHPHITSSEFHLPPPDPSTTTAGDPFFRQYDAVAKSAHLLSDHLSTLSPPPNAVLSDLMLAAGLNTALNKRGIDSFNVITTSAKFFSIMVSRGRVEFVRGQDLVIPGVGRIPADEVPPPMYDSEHTLSRLSELNSRHLVEAKGVILNTFDYFEKVSLLGFESGKVWSELPMVCGVGPLLTWESPPQGSNGTISWLDKQPSKSVVFVSFGSRTAMSKEQIKQIADGLEKRGMKFLWVIKTTVVDNQDKEELLSLLGPTFFEKTRDQGLIVKEWVNQEQILAHPSIGGFVTHCGWNSVMEAAQLGLPLLAWPLHGDQRVNAGVVKEAGLGIWERDWGGRLVMGGEIGEKIEELMSEGIRKSVVVVGEEARKAWEEGGSSRRLFEGFFGELSLNR